MTDFVSASSEFQRALLALDRVASRNILISIIEDKGTLETVESVVVPALERIGDGWESGEIALSQVYMGGRICEDLVDEILPPEETARKITPRIGIATLSDYHLLGRRIVYSTLRSAGYELTDFGHVDTARSLADLAIREKIEILLVSTLMLRSALMVKELTGILKEESPGIKTIVGGAPFIYDSELWKAVGADLTCNTASAAVSAISQITGGANATG